MQPDIVVTSLSKPVTDLMRAHLRSMVRKDIGRGRLTYLVDLRRLEDLDTATLSDLIRTRRWLREVGGSMDLLTDQPSVLKLLSITGLDRVFGVYRSEDEAFAALTEASLIPA